MGTTVFPAKPLGHSSYGSIGHLPGSRMDHNHQKYGTGQVAGKDFGISAGQARICTEKVRDKRDAVYVQEKLDGSNVGVANIDGTLVPMGRSGYPAISSKYEQHKLFAGWVFENADRFDFLKPGERVCGEWLAQAHGTVYDLKHGPFVAFDIMRKKQERVSYAEFEQRISDRFPIPFLIARSPTSIEVALDVLGHCGQHGAIDEVEGAVWRVERDGKVDFLAKYVRPSKVDGKYLPEISGEAAVWNWRPGYASNPPAIAADGAGKEGE